MSNRYQAIGLYLWQFGCTIVGRVRGTHAEYRNSIPVLTRFTAHLGIIALVVGGLLLSGAGISIAESPLAEGEDTEEYIPPTELEEGSNTGDLRPGVIPITKGRIEIVEAPAVARQQVLQYTVQPNDSVTRIAARFHISPESVLWANAKLQDNPDQLSIGQNLNIPPTTGVLYTVQSGDTIAAIANRFKAKMEDILDDPLNQGLHDFKANPPKLIAGQFLMVPKGQKAIETKRVVALGRAPTGASKGTSVFMWPTSGCIYQSFWSAHGALDLDNLIGTPIYAADSGYVAAAGGGWNYGYGNMVLLDHGNGYLTRYGHLSVIGVRAGQSVKKGQLIGRMGTTGNSTGPHLHFEVIKNGGLVNPLYQVSGRAPARCPGR